MVGPSGSVWGADISSKLVESAQWRAAGKGISSVRFERLDAQNLMSTDASFDVAVCALGPSDMCPLFFRLGRPEAPARVGINAGFGRIKERRLTVSLDYADAKHACDAAFMGWPVAMAWSRFVESLRARVRAHYVAAIKHGRAATTTKARLRCAQ